MESSVKALGFSSEQEFHELVASVPLVPATNLEKFKEWRANDGSKAGLLKAFPELASK